jgi:hypothetical protein
MRIHPTQSTASQGRGYAVPPCLYPTKNAATGVSKRILSAPALLVSFWADTLWRCFYGCPPSGLYPKTFTRSYLGWVPRSSLVFNSIHCNKIKNHRQLQHQAREVVDGNHNHEPNEHHKSDSVYQLLCMLFNFSPPNRLKSKYRQAATV